MKVNKFLLIVFLIFLVLPFVNPQFEADRTVVGSISTQYFQPNPTGGAGVINVNSYWNNYGKEECRERTDFLMLIPPGGCEPQVVRSDLLEEQNVPVFCKVSMIQVNPFVDVSKIKSVRFTGDYPQGVASLGYYPARAAIRSTNTLKGSPILENVGYLVVVLKQNPVEADMPDSILANITASVEYDVEDAFGIGETQFYLPVITDREWDDNYMDYSFWNGKGFLRVENVDSDEATISIYRDKDQRVVTKTIKNGRTSDLVYLPGYYCQAGFNVRLEELDAPVDKAKIQVNDQTMWVREGDRFFEDTCTVQDLKSYEYGGGEIKIHCRGAGSEKLTINSGEVNLSVKGVNDIYTVNQKVLSEKDTEGKTWNYYVAYIGDNKDKLAELEKTDKENFVVIVKTTDTDLTFANRQISAETYKYMHNLEEYDFLEGVKRIGTFTSYLTKNIAFLGIPGIVESFDNELVYEKNIMERVVYRYIEGQEIKNKFLTVLETVFTLKPEGVFPNLGGIWILKNNRIGNDLIKLNSINLNEDVILDLDSELESSVDYFYQQSLDAYDELKLDYSNLKRVNGDDKNFYGDPYGAYSLWEKAELSSKLDMRQSEMEFLQQLVDEYPDSNYGAVAMSKIRVLEKYSKKDSRAVYNSRLGPVFVDVLDFRYPTKNEASATVVITDGIGNRDTVTLSLNEVYLSETKLEDLDVRAFIKLVELRDDTIRIEYNYNGALLPNALENTKASTLVSQANLRIDQETRDLVGSPLNIQLTDLKLNKEAKIRLIPKVTGPRSEANLTFQIGIEKRAIQLSPEKISEKIAKLNETIDNLNETSAKLEKSIRVLRGGCFATSAILTAKNAFLNRDESIARQQVMTLPGGWNQACADKEVGGKESGTVSKCYLDNEEQINKDVEAYKVCLQKTDEQFDELRDNTNVEKDSFLFGFIGTVIDSEKEEDAYRDDYFDLDKIGSETVTLPDKSTRAISSIIKDTKELSLTEMRDINTFLCIRKAASGTNSVLTNISNQKLSLSLNKVNSVQTRDESQGRRIELAQGIGKDATASTNFESSKTIYVSMTEAIGDFKEIKEGNKISFETIPSSSGTTVVGGVNRPNARIAESISGKDIVISYEQVTSEKFEIEKAYVLEKVGDKNTVGIEVTNEVIVYYDSLGIANNGFKKVEENMFKNTYLNLEVRFHELAPYQGLPSLVPFDEKEGWYVSTEYIISGFGKPYQESGAPINFYICNVGSNGREEGRSNDDICTYINLETGAEKKVLSLDSRKSQDLITRAKDALKRAAQQKADGETCIRISNVNKCMDIGAPEGFTGGNCEEFMSPSECRILYNLCDPVICPSNRCNFGGRFNVPNVAQSGILGSLALCLPNFPQVFIPICLTGVKAGIDGYISILRSARSCLQESLDSGRTTGICDQIQSLYLCDLFWRNAGPLADVLIPNAIEALSGGIVRGGGEYLNAQDSWNYMKESVDFFTNSYAINAINAFKIRSTEEVGTEVCKSFVSARYPTGGDFFDNLLTPEVPEQYHGWFEEIPLTTATLPATSQYKVYFHIYAGKDQGASYTVYLKNPEESGFFNVPSRRVVDSGYIAINQEVDKTQDFTDVTGYKQLCISVNGQDKCGFKQVSTSAAVNYVSSKYVQDQATEEITKTDDCVAGTPSALSLVTPNLQSGVQEGLTPAIYNRGIIRVCSSTNPGIEVQTNEELERAKTQDSSYERWKEVGYCDNENLKCWLDQNSVKEAVYSGAKGILNDTLADIDKINLKNAFENGTLTPQEVNAVLDEVGKVEFKDVQTKLKAIGGLKTIGSIENNDYFRKKFLNLNKVINGAATNEEKALALISLGKLNGFIALELYNNLKDEWKKRGVTKPGVTGFIEAGEGGEEVEEIFEFVTYTIADDGTIYKSDEVSATGSQTKVSLSEDRKNIYYGDSFENYELIISYNNLKSANIERYNLVNRGVPPEEEEEVREILVWIKENYWGTVKSYRIGLDFLGAFEKRTYIPGDGYSQPDLNNQGIYLNEQETGLYLVYQERQIWNILFEGKIIATFTNIPGTDEIKITESERFNEFFALEKNEFREHFTNIKENYNFKSFPSSSIFPSYDPSGNILNKESYDVVLYLKGTNPPTSSSSSFPLLDIDLSSLPEIKSYLKDATLKDLYVDNEGYNRADLRYSNYPFSAFILNRHIDWIPRYSYSTNTILLKDEDNPFVEESGYLRLEVDEKWEGRIVLEIFDDGSYFEKNSILPGGYLNTEARSRNDNNHGESFFVVLKAGDAILIDVDKTQGSDSFRIIANNLGPHVTEGSGEKFRRSSTNAINEGVEVTLISIIYPGIPEETKEQQEAKKDLPAGI